MGAAAFWAIETLLFYNPIFCSIAPLLLIFLFHRFWLLVAAGAARLLRNLSKRRRRELACLSGDSPRWGDSPFAGSVLFRQSVHRKTKIPPFLQLICDYGLFFVPLKRKEAVERSITCVFAPRFAIGGTYNNPQSQKSCSPSRISVFSLIAMVNFRAAPGAGGPGAAP